MNDVSPSSHLAELIAAQPAGRIVQQPFRVFLSLDRAIHNSPLCHVRQPRAQRLVRPEQQRFHCRFRAA